MSLVESVIAHWAPLVCSTVKVIHNTQEISLTKKSI